MSGLHIINIGWQLRG